MKNPLISVLVAAYNVERYLPRFFEKIENQAYNHLEIILVDDGSTDATGRLCDSFAEKHENIKVVHTTNSGVSVARNMSLNNATGDFISFVDPDDDISIDFYSKVATFIETVDCDLIILNRLNIYPDGKKVEIRHFNESGIIEKDTVMQMLFDETLGSQLWEKVYRRDLWEGIRFTPGRVYAEDVAVLHRVVDKAHKIGAIAEPLYYYHINEATLTTSYRPFKWMSTYLAFKERLEYAEVNYPQMTSKLRAITLNMARLTLDNYILRHEPGDEPYMAEIIDRLKMSKGYLYSLKMKWYNKLIISYYIHFPGMYRSTIKYIHRFYYFFNPNKFR